MRVLHVTLRVCTGGQRSFRIWVFCRLWQVTAKATVLFATTASFGMLVMAMQNLGLIGMMTVEWPISLQGLFSICQFLLLDIDSYGFSCIAGGPTRENYQQFCYFVECFVSWAAWSLGLCWASCRGQSEPVRYLLSALIFPLGVAWMALCYALSKLFPKKHHWEGPKVCSTMGAFLQLGFSTMSATALAPMMCYRHPNGLRSILKYPGVHLWLCRTWCYAGHCVGFAPRLCLRLRGAVYHCGLDGRTAAKWDIWKPYETL